MAYKQVINLALSVDKPKTLFQHVRDFLTATGLYDATSGVGGWTVINSFYAVNSTTLTDNDWCLLQTTGESGNWDFRVLLKVTTLGLISFSGGNWTNLTSAAVTVSVRFGLATEAIATPANWTALYLYADKDFANIIVRAGTTNYVHRFGIMTMISPEPVLPVGILANISNGSNVNISVADSSPSHFAVGKRIQLLDYNATNCESSVITSNNTGTDIITVANNAGSYASASAKISSFFPYFIDAYLSKSVGYTFYSFVTNLDSAGAGALGGFSYGLTLVDASFPGAPNPFNLKFHATKQQYTTGGSSGMLFQAPDWCLMTKKRSTEAEQHTDGTNNYRYFSYYNDTSTIGLMFRE